MPGRRGKKTSIGGQFAPRLIEMLESPASRVLSLSGERVLKRIEIELGHHGGNDNGKLPVTFDHFEEYGIHRHSIGPAIREVVALGFVEITREGRAGNAEWRVPTLFRLTYRATDKIDVTDEWRKIETVAEAEQIAAQARAAKKQKSSGGKCQISVRFPHQKPEILGADSTTTVSSAESTTTSISREATDIQTSPLARGPSNRQARQAGVSDEIDPSAIGAVASALLKRLDTRFQKKSALAEIQKSGDE